MTVAVVLMIMVAVRVANRRGPVRAQPIIGPAAAILLVAVCGLTPAQAGLTLSGGAYAVGAALLVAAGYGVAVLIPATRRQLAARDFPSPVRTALVGVPLSTVVFEEVAFRGVLWGLLFQAHGMTWATVVTAGLFGLWHLPGGTDVAFTTLAGVLLSFLRLAAGGLLAPFVLHWTANGLGILISAGVRRRVLADGGDRDKS